MGRKKEYTKQYRKNNPWAKHMGYIRNRCRTHPNYNGDKIYRELTITTQELKEIWFRDRGYLLKRPSIDRKDNEKGYTKENCQFIELRENVIKGGKIKQLRGKWSFLYDKCIECGTTQRKHYGKGLCRNCYQRKWDSKNIEKRRARQRIYWRARNLLKVKGE